MSVQYHLTKHLKVKDLEDLGFYVEKTKEKNCHPYLVRINKDDEDGVAISKLAKDGEIREFEGRFSEGGISVIKEICIRAHSLFLTDEDENNKFLEALDNTPIDEDCIEINYTEADYLYRAKKADLDMKDEFVSYF